MQGKILADGLISGNDGKRYTYSAGDLKNAQGKSLNAIIGSEVDFEVAQSADTQGGTANADGANGKARDIYITAQANAFSKDRLKSTLKNVDNALNTFDAGAAKGRLKSALSLKGLDGLAKVKKMSYAMLALFVLGSFVPFVGLFLKIAALVFGILATKELRQMSQSRALLKKFVAFFVLAWLVLIFSPSGGGAINMPLIGNYGSRMPSMTGAFSATMANSMIAGAAIGAAGLQAIVQVLAVLFFVPAAFIFHRYTKELAFISEQRYFRFAFWLGLVGLLPLAFFGKTLILLAAVAFYALAWHKTTQIRKSYTAG